MIYNVSSAAQLQSVLASAKGGDIISLAAGNYGNVLISGRNYTSAVTIKSAVGTSAHFDQLMVDKSSFVTFDKVDIGRGLAAGEVDFTKLATVQNSNNIKMHGVSIHGSMDGNSGNDGFGLFVRNTNGFELSGSNLEQLNRGMVVERSWNVNVSDTRFNDLRSDGINVAGVVGVTLDGNTFTNFRPTGGDHADAIQFWNSGQPFGSRDIVIKNNVVLGGDGFGPQGIFINDANGMRYSNVVIENNLIYGNDSYHGIHVAGADNVRIVGNTTLSHQTDAQYMWIKVADVRTINLSNNLSETNLIGSGVTGLTQSNNQTLWANPQLKALIPDLNFADSVADLIIPNVGYQIPTGGGGEPAPQPAPPPPPPAINQLIDVFGTGAAYETVRGSASNEKLFGIPKVHAALGGKTRDKLYGGGGADTFVLGDERGLFYDDKLATSGGWADHALIMDFDAGDKIQLVGQMADYVFLPNHVIGGVRGTSIFRDDNGDGKVSQLDEYIAHVSGSPAALALNATYFTFVANGAMHKASDIDAPVQLEQAVVEPEVDEPTIADFSVDNLPAPLSSFAVDYFAALP